MLKWDGDPGNGAARLRGVRLAERLREVGWPVPQQHVHRDGPWLAVSSLEHECDNKTKHMLMEVGIEGLDQARRLAYVANMILRFLDWAIRKNRPSEIDFWLDHADWLFGES